MQKNEPKPTCRTCTAREEYVGKPDYCWVLEYDLEDRDAPACAWYKDKASA